MLVGRTEATETAEAPDAPADRARPAAPGWRAAVLAVAVVGLAVSPVVVGAFSLVGDTWHPAGDFAHFVYKVSQVGTRDTPLVGTYTVKGWAHPGPLGFWLSAPLYRLTGGDPRALQWTAAAANVVVLGCLAAVAWRRGRWPLLLGVTALIAVVVHGVGPENLVDLWNPYLPLTSFLLTVFLVWDAALGRRRALVEAVIPATFAMHNHLAFVSLAALLGLWLYAWVRWWPRVVTPGDDEPGRDELPRAPWAPWRRVVIRGALISGVLWLPALADALFDLHNPWNIARSFGSSQARVGPADALGLVGRYVRPDGPWMGGTEPRTGVMFSVVGSGPVPLLLVVGLLVACLVAARRRGFADATALTTLALVLVVGAVPAVAQIPIPNEVYLTQWLKVVGGFAWFAVLWTGWRLVEPWVRQVPLRRTAAAAVAGAVVLAGAATTWGKATQVELPLDTSGRQVQELVAQLDGKLPRDETIRVDRRGEFWHIFGAGVFYALAEDGYDVVTDEGYAGLKWGHEHRWGEGEPYDLLLTVAVDRAVDECRADPRAEQLASWDWLSPADRRWLSDVQLRRLAGEDAVSTEDKVRAAELGRHDLRLAIFEGPRVCADPDRFEFLATSDRNVLPLVAGAAGAMVLAAGAGTWFVLHRRRATP
ncbi:MAG TPA: hypothetical protein VK611_22415 [Acidimicrobiales bacterium]|nr:hypothetical protein [Acidimicrobiales bacterium]